MRTLFAHQDSLLVYVDMPMINITNINNLSVVQLTLAELQLILAKAQLTLAKVQLTLVKVQLTFAAAVLPNSPPEVLAAAPNAGGAAAA